MCPCRLTGLERVAQQRVGVVEVEDKTECLLIGRLYAYQPSLPPLPTIVEIEDESSR